MQAPKGEEINLDAESARSLLLSGSASATTQPRQRFGLLLGLFLLGCIVVSLTLAWTGKTEADGTHNMIKKSGISTDEAVFNDHQASSLNGTSLKSVANAVNVEDLKTYDLRPLLIPRVAGTSGSRMAREHIVGRLNSIGGWDINLHTFQSDTPFGMKTFTNIIATVNPDVKRRLVLACHYDSKYFIEFKFVGATDAALPCAQLLYLARSLAGPLRRATNNPITLQLIFFDGHESFIRWTEADSLYGSRQLAEDYASMATTVDTPLGHVGGMDMLVLLNHLGSKNPVFDDFFPRTSVWYNHIREIEQRLNMLTRSKVFSGMPTYYFQSNGPNSGGWAFQDDHIPFITNFGVRTLLLISYPFPKVWHTEEDNAAALDDDTISKLSTIFHVFVAEYLGLSAP